MSNDKNSKKKQNPVKSMVLLAVMGLLVVALFFVISNRSKPTEDGPAPISAVQELLVNNLDTNYPATPKEVVKMYCEITRCFYAEKYTDEELYELAKMSRKLFDDELVNNQTEDNYIRSLKGEISNYRAMGRVISSYSLSSSADVEYYNYENFEWAQLVAMYSIRTGKNIEPSKERYLLRKDDKGHWKIYGWRLEDLNATGEE